MNSSSSSQQVPTGTEITPSAVTSSDSTIQNTSASHSSLASQSSASSSNSFSSSSPPPPTSMSAAPSPSPSESSPAPSSSSSGGGTSSSSDANSPPPSSTPSSSSSPSTPPPSSSPTSTPPPPSSSPTSSPSSTSSTSADTNTTSSSSSSSPSPPPSSSTSSQSSSPSITPSSTQSGNTSSPLDSSASPTISPSASSNTPPLTSPQPSQSSSEAVTIVTSVFTSTVDGQLKTITTIFPSTVSFNTPPSSSASSSRNTGVIVGSAIGGTVVVLLLLSGIFLLYRRGFRRKAVFSRLPTAPRSPPLHEQDFDLEGPSQQPTLPSLLPVRGSESGSIFREEVWPPPNSGSRLQDPLLAASRIDLNSIVDAVMGPTHPRWSSADTASSEPLLGRDTPDGHSVRPSTSGSNQMGVGSQNPIGAIPGVGPSQQPPTMSTGTPHQPAMGVGSSAGQTAVHPAAAADGLQQSPTTLGNPINMSPLPPGAAPPFTPFLNRQVNRQRRPESIQSSGSPPPTDLRAERSAFGPLMVINSSPDGDQDMPLVDLSSSRNERGSNNIPTDHPPLYHTLPNLTTEPLQPTRKGEGSLSPPPTQ